MHQRLIFLIAMFLFSAQALGSEYIVKYSDNSLAALSLNPSVQIMDQHHRGNLVKLDVAEESEAETLAQVMATPGVEYVVPNFKLHAFRTPINMMALREQWAIAKVNAEKAWEIAGNKGSKKVVVAVIDTGVDYNHESLKPNAVQGFDFKGDDDDPMDETGFQNPGHGTHVAGAIGATGLVDGGIIGLSPEVSLMPLRFLGADGSGDLMAGIRAIDWAIDQGAKVINASWGATVSRSQAQPLIEAVQRASDAGVIFVAAAANDGRNNDRTDVFPANAIYDNTITVAASGPNDEKPSWSNYGRSTVHLASPGLDIMSTLPKNKYGNLSGTSMAAPLVAGLVAFLLAQDESLSGLHVKSLLQATGVKASIETACNCRVDAAAAVESIKQKKMFVSPYAMTVPLQGSQQFTGVYGEAPFTFESTNPAVATISEDGLLTAVSDGETTIKVTDAKGKTATSSTILIGQTGGGDDGGGGGGGMECPIGDPALCDQICQVMPSLPWCQ